MAITESELHAFYAQLGEALYSVQIVEGTLHRVLAIKVDFAGQKVTQAEADRVLEAYRLKTLGGLIGVAARNAVLPDALLSGLQDFNAERRFVVHRLQDEADERLRSDVVYRDDILRRLDRIATMGFSINSALTDFLVKSTPLAHEEGTRFRAALKDQLRRRGF